MKFMIYWCWTIKKNCHEHLKPISGVHNSSPPSNISSEYIPALSNFLYHIILVFYESVCSRV